MPVKAAFPGTVGSFSWSAARELFPGAELQGYERFEQAAGAALDGEADYALLPIENSFAGIVLPTCALLEHMPLHIVGELQQPVRHNLLGVQGATLEGLRQISSHPQAIAQCDSFLSTLQGVQLIPSTNTALSAREVAARGDPGCGAIASLAAAEVFGLAVLRADIQTDSRNTTRFVALSRSDSPLGPPDKATVVFQVKNEVGALANALRSFADSGLNMVRIESRPLPGSPFEYFFSADFSGRLDAGVIRQAMDAARAHTVTLRLLGLYPQAAQQHQPL